MASEAQLKALVILPKLTGFVSILCSALIVFSVLRDPKKRARIYHRLLLGISVVDISNSFWLGICSTWPIPKESGAMFAAGSKMTCTIQGFFIQVGIAMSFYSCSLALYYLLVLRFNWSEDRVRPIEPFMHSIPLLWGLSTAIMSIPLTLFNNANLWCWIASYPQGCQGDDCIRGKDAETFRWAFFYGPLWGSILFVSVIMVVVFLHVRSVAKSLGKEEANTNRGDGTDDQALINDNDQEGVESNWVEQQRQSKRVRRDVALQCFLYSGSFYFTWIWLTCVRVMQASEAEVPYKLLAVAAFTTPCQGLPNILVYLFPKFLAVKEANPGAGLLGWIRDSL